MAPTLGEPVEHLVERAILTATRAHTGQLDKQGEIYILHPLRVMMAVPADPTLRAIAVMHDVLEDSEANGHLITATHLLAEDWPSDVVTALVALTHGPEEDYMDYVLRVCDNPLARQVKIFDVNDNLGRIDGLNPTLAERLGRKYEKALTLLL